MHIPRTAGTAFREAIAANYKQSEIAYLYPDPPGFLVEDLRLLPLQQRSRFHIVFGHFRYGVHEWFPQPSQYIAIVRHPFSRIVSHYFYLSQANPSAITAYGRKLNLVETLEHQLTVNLDNAVVRCFSGVDESDVPPGAVDRDVYNLAMHRLRNSFAFVGHQEYAEQAFASLRRQFGWSQHPHLDKVNSNPKLPDSLQQEKVRAAVEHYNRWDYLFYKDLLERFPPK